MERDIRLQIERARDARPGLDGIIHGIRPIKQGKHGSRSSLFYSAKNQALIPVESRLEQAFCYHLEADSDVGIYRTQALAIPYRAHALFPDFLIFDVSGIPYVREIKHSSFVETKRNAEKISYLLSTLARFGLELAVLTDRDLSKGTKRENIKMLYDRGGRLSPSDQLLERVVSVVRSTSQTSNMKAIRRAMHQEDLPSYLLEAAIFKGILCCRLDRPINGSTEIEVAA